MLNIYLILYSINRLCRIMSNILTFNIIIWYTFFNRLINSFSWVHRLVIDFFAFQLLVYAPNSSQQDVKCKYIWKGVTELNTKEISNNTVAVKYLGRALISLIVGIIIVILAILGYNSNINITKKGIEVQSQNSNSILNGYE